MKVACITDMGKVRDINEDCYEYCRLKEPWELILVADGMGGHNAGEVASRIAVNTITEFIKTNIKEIMTDDEIKEMIKKAIIKANNDIYMEAVNNINYSGMGTTVTVALLSKYQVFIGHVGDSRAYIWDEEKLFRLTNDHSLVAELVKNGTITESEAQHHPQKNIITRALGTNENIEVDIEYISKDNEFTLMLCTDGLTNLVSDSEIQDALLTNSDVQIVVQELVGLANEHGGHDNITIIIAKVSCHDSEVRQ